MKIQILQLEPHDGLASTLDKIGWGKAERILLVWPEKARILQRRLDLVLIQRRSLALGAQLALVTRDPRVRFFAFRAGIPVFSTLKKAQSKPWPEFILQLQEHNELVNGHLQRTKRIKKINLFNNDFLSTPKNRKRFPLDSLLLRLVIFSLAVFSFLFLAAILFPRAEIVIEPSVKSQETTWVIHPNPHIEQALLSGEAPAREISLVVEGRDEISSSGSVLFPEKSASGTAEFTNLTEASIRIGEGTIVRSVDDQRFVITSPGTLPAGPGMTVNLPVRSQQPGTTGNLPAGSLVGIEGVLASQASVTNASPLQGGSDRRYPGPSTADRRLLAAQLYKDMEKTAYREMQKKLSEQDLLIPGSLSKPEVVSEVYSPADNSPANEISLHLQLEYKAWYIPAASFFELANAVMDANLPQGYIPVAGSLSTTLVDASQPFAIPGGKLTLNLKREISAEVKEAVVVRNVLGKPVAQAKSALTAAFPLNNQPVIRMTPAWWPFLPVIPFRIAVVADNSPIGALADD